MIPACCKCDRPQCCTHCKCKSCMSNCNDYGELRWRQPVKKVELWIKLENQPICWLLLPVQDKKCLLLTWVRKTLLFFKPYCLLWDTLKQCYIQYLADNCKVHVESDQTQQLTIISVFHSWKHGWPGVNNSTVECVLVDLFLTVMKFV